MLKVCVYTSTGNYSQIADYLNMYIDKCEIETSVRPFMLPYRDYDLYVMDAYGLPQDELVKLYDKLPIAARNTVTSVFAFWSAPTWDRLVRMHPRTAELENCVNCSGPNWIQPLLRALRRAKRKTNGNR